MISQAGFSLRGRNPDVLTCIANLSNDEVFTPPALANRMLDSLAQAWSTNNNGENIWGNSSVKFLDPFTKSGIFLREIAARLIRGLETEIPDLRERVDHVLTKQVLGIGITQLTALLARRSLYCSKHATSEHSVAKSFSSDNGNIWFQRIDHTWVGSTRPVKVTGHDGKSVSRYVDGKCKYCGAPRALFDRGSELENHAYAFIHTENIKARVKELFGGKMQFDVIIGNPPYQMTGGAGGTSDSSIYHLFVEQAIRLEPRYVGMVIPSRWMAGGRGMDDFRRAFLGGGHLRELVDFPASSEVFPGVEIKAGICYFLWDRDYEGTCAVTTVRGNDVIGPVSRKLDEYDIFVRDGRAVSILHKVLGRGETPINTILSRDTAFGLASNFDDFRDKKRSGDIDLYYIRRMKRGVGYVNRKLITKSKNIIDKWKVLVPEAYNGGDGIPHQIVGKPEIGVPPSVCTQSYLVFHVDSLDAAKSLQSYYASRFFRFLVSQRKITQHALHSTYQWVPVQTWDRIWFDDVLYKKYQITREEQEYIEAQVRAMDIADADSE